MKNEELLTKYPIFDHVPEGWRVPEGAINHPKGYRWITNNKSLFAGEQKRAFVPEQVAIEWRKRNKDG